MADEGGVISGAASGAAAGSAFGPWGTIIGAGLGLLGGMMTNDANSANAAKANQQSWEMFEANAQFQERMSNTAHQREVKDLIAAGLNPMLSARLGGASTPSGGTTNVANVPKLENPVPAAVSSASAVAQIANTDANTEVQKSQLEVNTAQAAKLRAETSTELNRPDNVASQTDVNRAQLPQIKAMVNKIKEETDLAGAQIYQIQKQIEQLLPAQRAQLMASAAHQSAQATLDQLASFGAQNQANFEKRNPNLMPQARAAGTILNSAGAAGRAIESGARVLKGK